MASRRYNCNVAVASIEMPESYYGPGIELSRRGMLQLLLERLPRTADGQAIGRKLAGDFCRLFKLDQAELSAAANAAAARLQAGEVEAASNFEPLTLYAAAIEAGARDGKLDSKARTYLKLFGTLLRISPEQHAQAIRLVKSRRQPAAVTSSPPELSAPEQTFDERLFDELPPSTSGALPTMPLGSDGDLITMPIPVPRPIARKAPSPPQGAGKGTGRR